MCYELWHGAMERRSGILPKPILGLPAIPKSRAKKEKKEPPRPDPWEFIQNVNIHFVGGGPSPYELGDYDGWGHQVRILEDIDDYADRDAWERVA